MSWQGNHHTGSGSGHGYGYIASSSSYENQSQSREDREQHMKKKVVWICQKCKKQFASKSGLDRHLTKVHEIPKTPKPKAKAKAPPREKAQSAVCNVCDKTLTSQGRLSRHIETVHQKSRGPAVTKKTKVVKITQTNVTVNMNKPMFNQVFIRR